MTKEQEQAQMKVQESKVIGFLRDQMNENLKDLRLSVKSYGEHDSITVRMRIRYSMACHTYREALNIYENK